MRALSRAFSPTARVVRDGVLVEVDAASVVPGDLLVVTEGDRVAADARLVDAGGLEVDEAPLTGESFPSRNGRRRNSPSQADLPEHPRCCSPPRR